MKSNLEGSPHLINALAFGCIRIDRKYVFFNLAWVKVVLVGDHGTDFNRGEEKRKKAYFVGGRMSP